MNRNKNILPENFFFKECLEFVLLAISSLDNLEFIYRPVYTANVKALNFFFPAISYFFPIIMSF